MLFYRVIEEIMDGSVYMKGNFKHLKNALECFNKVTNRTGKLEFKEIELNKDYPIIDRYNGQECDGVIVRINLCEIEFEDEED
jgi:hypothetical protein